MLCLSGFELYSRWVPLTLATAAWGGTAFTFREKQTSSLSRGDGRRRFFNFRKVRENEFSERDPSDIGLLLYDGVIADEEFVFLYNEI